MTFTTMRFPLGVAQALHLPYRQNPPHSASIRGKTCDGGR